MANANPDGGGGAGAGISGRSEDGPNEGPIGNNEGGSSQGGGGESPGQTEEGHQDESQSGVGQGAKDPINKAERIGDKVDKPEEKAPDKPKEEQSDTKNKNIDGRRTAEAQTPSQKSERATAASDINSRGAAPGAAKMSGAEAAGQQQTRANELSSRSLANSKPEDNAAEQAIRDIKTVSNFFEAHPKGQATSDQKAALNEALGGDTKSEIKITEHKIQGRTAGYSVSVKKGDTTKEIAVPADKSNPEAGVHVTTRGNERVRVDVYKKQGTYYGELKTPSKYEAFTSRTQLGPTPRPSPGPRPNAQPSKKELSKEAAPPKTPEPRPERERAPQVGPREREAKVSPQNLDDRAKGLPPGGKPGAPKPSSTPGIIPPPYPPGAGIENTLRMADIINKVSRGVPGVKYKLFYDLVKNKGAMDYKQRGKEFSPNPYEATGNFNFGVLGRALGIPADVLLRSAGMAQWRAGTSKPEWGTPWGGAPYGDDPDDQAWIKRGIDYYEELQRTGKSPADIIEDYKDKPISIQLPGRR